MTDKNKNTDYVVVNADDFQQLNFLKRYDKLGGFVAGGAFKNIFSGEKVKDIDIFFLSEAAWAKAVKRLRKAKHGYKEIYSNARVVAFIDPVNGIRVELIGSETNPEFPDSVPVKYQSVTDTISDFDFTVVKFAFVREGDEWLAVYHPQFFEHLKLKRLSIDGELVKPLSTFERVLRYTAYGYRLCRDSKVTLINEIQGAEFETDAQISASFYDGVD